jgi:endonuclease/exonuclease/phosphatase family metal-dependent hydrolase
MRSFRVATLNIWNVCGPWPERLRAIRHELATLDADVIGLQEVLRPGAGIDGPDQAQAIAEGFGYVVAFGSARDEPIQFGNAILSRWPIGRVEVERLPAVGTDESRCLLYTEIDAPFGRLPIAVTHLNWKLDEGHVRQEQLRFVTDRIRALAPAADFPPILVGDLNAPPDADEIRFLRGLCALGGRSVYHYDAFLCAGGGGPGTTFAPSTNPFAAFSHEPDRRIDYVMIQGPDDRGRGKPLSARVCFDQPFEGVLPSDHYGVIAELSTGAA